MRFGYIVQLRVDVRIVAASNVELLTLVREGRFREDLFYRLNVIHLLVPPLRDRREDIKLMIQHFLEQFTRSNNYTVRAISPEAIAALTEYAWPGNVRELENTIERVVVVGRNEVVGVDDLPRDVGAVRRGPGRVA